MCTLCWNVGLSYQTKPVVWIVLPIHFFIIDQTFTIYEFVTPVITDTMHKFSHTLLLKLEYILHLTCSVSGLCNRPQLCWDFSVGLLFMNELSRTVYSELSLNVSATFWCKCDSDTGHYQDVCWFISQWVSSLFARE